MLKKGCSFVFAGSSREEKGRSGSEDDVAVGGRRRGRRQAAFWAQISPLFNMHCFSGERKKEDKNIFKLIALFLIPFPLVV